LAQHFYVPKLSSISKTVWERCSLCARNNPWYLLVFVYIFSGWIKAFPTWTKKSQRSGQVPIKGNHPSIQNTCVYWIKQWADLCDRDGTVDS
jgi:hypothetical protein